MKKFEEEELKSWPKDRVYRMALKQNALIDKIFPAPKKEEKKPKKKV